MNNQPNLNFTTKTWWSVYQVPPGLTPLTGHSIVSLDFHIFNNKSDFFSRKQKRGILNTIKECLQEHGIKCLESYDSRLSFKNEGHIVVNGFQLTTPDQSLCVICDFRHGAMCEVLCVCNKDVVKDSLLADLIEALGRSSDDLKISLIPKSDDSKIPIRVFMPTGERDMVYYCDRLPYETIRENYSDVPEDGRRFSTRYLLDQLIHNYDPKIGRIVLLHGSPGTGKTYFLRALISEMDDASAIYVQHAPAFLSSVRPTISDKRSIYLFEDSGSLLDSQGRVNVQIFSNLLNLTDGLLGSHGDMYIFTFNTPITDIDPAFRRPGRMFADIYFSNLTEKEAIAFLKRNLSNPTDEMIQSILPNAQVAGRYNLAKLYALLNTNTLLSSEKKTQKIGFIK
jgi:hypothetical protein